jgi:hypothetical protein
MADEEQKGKRYYPTKLDRLKKKKKTEKVGKWKATVKEKNSRVGRLPNVHHPTVARPRGGRGKSSRLKPPKKPGRKPCNLPPLRAIRRGLTVEQANYEAREKFLALLNDGTTYRRAMHISGICQVEAAQLVDKALSQTREGTAAFLLAEDHLIESMKVLSELMKDDPDSKVRLMAAAKLSDTSYKILNNRKFFDKSKKQAEENLEKVRSMKNTWDIEFEQNDELPVVSTDIPSTMEKMIEEDKEDVDEDND